MAIEVYDFGVTIPTGSSPAAPQTFPLTITRRVVTDIEIKVPPGPRGEVGFALGAAGEPFIPRQRGTWIITDNEVIRWPLEDQITSGAWQLIAYNTGLYPHTLHIRFLVRLTSRGASSPNAPLPASVLSSVG